MDKTMTELKIEFATVSIKALWRIIERAEAELLEAEPLAQDEHLAETLDKINRIKAALLLTVMTLD